MSRKVEIELIAKTEKFFKSIQQSNAGMFFLAQNVDMAGKAISTLTQIISDPTKKILEFENAMIAVSKTTDIEKGTKAFEELTRNAIENSIRLGENAIKITEIQAAAGQLGIRGVENINAFTTAVANSARALNQDTDSIASDFAKIATILNVPIQQSQRMGDAINELENNTTAKTPFIVEAIKRIGNSGDALRFKLC